MKKLTELSYFEKWFILGAIIGVVAGLGALVFYFSLKLSEYIFLETILGIRNPSPVGEGGSLEFVYDTSRYVLIPFVVGLGGALSGLLVYTFAPEAEGHGTDAAIESFHKKAGKVRWRVIPVKTIASAITIGSGGSAGREGPTAQIASGIGSIIAEVLKLPSEDRRKAVAVGIGAGIGSIFKTPIGGALLAAEVLYKRDFEVEVIFPAFVASAIGYSIFASVVGFKPIFGYYVSSFSPLTLPMHAILGIVCGLMAIIYVKMFYGIHEFFHKLTISNYFKPMIGGILAGTITLIFPEVMSMGYGWVQILEYNELEKIPNLFGIPLILTLVALPFVKILVTSLTIGSGGSGGVFAPGICTGAFIGAIVGLVFHYLFPSLVPSIAPFVIVGMLSLFGAAGKVPLSVTLMIVEMTGSLQLLPSAMIAVAISYMISKDYSIYRSQVPTRKDSPAHISEFNMPLLTQIKVSEAKITNNIFLKPADSTDKAIKLINESGFTSLPVVDDNFNFLGVVYINDLLNGKSNTIEKLVRKEISCVSLDSSLDEVLSSMVEAKSVWAPVVKGNKLLGIITLEEIIKTYKNKLNDIWIKKIFSAKFSQSKE